MSKEKKTENVIYRKGGRVETVFDWTQMLNLSKTSMKLF